MTDDETTIRGPGFSGPDAAAPKKESRGLTEIFTGERRMSLLFHPGGRRFYDTARYTRFVRYMRVILPLMAMVMIMMLLIWPQLGSEQSFVSQMEAASLDLEKDIRENRLVTARFESADSKGRPFVVEADEASQDYDSPDIIQLKFPRASLTQTDGSRITVQARKGLYRQESEVLALSDEVYFTRSDGSVMKMDSITGSLKKGEAASQDKVTIESPSGTLEAQGLRVEGEGSRIIFKGPVRLRFDSKSGIVPTSEPLPPLQEIAP